MLSIMAVSSPHTYDPAPILSSISKVKFLPKIFLPSKFLDYKFWIASVKKYLASGYSERR